MSRGALRPGMRAVVMMMSKALHSSSSMRSAAANHSGLISLA